MKFCNMMEFTMEISEENEKEAMKKTSNKPYKAKLLYMRYRITTIQLQVEMTCGSSNSLTV
jgi:hypothetical protein